MNLTRNIWKSILITDFKPVYRLVFLMRFSKTKRRCKKNCILFWELHTEYVTTEKVEVGAAIIFYPENVEEKFKDRHQHLIVSKPSKYMKHWILSANAKE